MTVDAPTNATGYAVDVPVVATPAWWFGTPLVPETVAELQWPASVATYRQMARDAQVASVLRAVRLPVLRTPWRIDPNGARDEVVEHVANDLGLPIVGEGERPVSRTRGRFSWLDHLWHAQTSYIYGHAFFEQEAVIDENGRAHLHRLGFRPQETLTAINVARDGGLVDIRQAGTPDPIPVKRLVAYTHGRLGGNWIGEPPLRAAYKDWILKDQLLRTDTIKHHRNGIGIPVFTGSENPTDPEAERAAGQELVQSVRGGDNAGAALSNGQSLDLLSIKGTLPDALPRIRYHDESLAKVLLGHVFNLGQQTGTGSYALGLTFVNVFDEAVAADAAVYRDTANAHIVEDLVDWNWGTSEPAPRLVFDPIGSHKDLTAQGIALLIQAGLIKPDRSLEEWVRQQADMPPKDPLPGQEAA